MRISDWSSDVCSSDRHDMGEPRGETVPRIVAHGTLLGSGAECVGDTLGGTLVVGRERDADMAIVEDGVVLAIGLLDLVQALRDEEGADAIACQEGEARLEEVEASKHRELVEHHQQALSVIRVTSSISV